MNDIEDVVSNVINNDNNKGFDKEKWIKQKNEDRQKAYDMIDKTANDIVTNIDKYKVYLDVQSRFDKYSVGNGLLITAQMPNATKIKDYQDWKGAIKDFKNPIIILEPSSQYTRADKTVATSYNPKKMYDISHTNIKDKTVEMNYDDKLKLAGLLNESPVNVKIVDSIENSNQYAQWNKNDNVLYIKKCENIKELLPELAIEYAKVSLGEINNTELDNFKCNSVAYMIAKKYDIDTSKIKLDTIPYSLSNMESREIRNELESVKTAMEDMNSRMSKKLEEVAKKQKNKEQVR